MGSISHVEGSQNAKYFESLNIRSNVPNVPDVHIESGLLPLKAVILVRQFKFYKQRFFETVEKNSRRDKMLNMLLEVENRTKYLQHYEDLVTRYESTKDIVNEYRNLTKQRIYTKANTGHYKHYIYTRINPELTTSPFLDVLHPSAGEVIRFRLGSHYLPIETGRWSGQPRHERLCGDCNEVGDEDHIIYRCCLIEREDLTLNEDIGMIWNTPDIYTLFKRIKASKLV